VAIGRQLASELVAGRSMLLLRTRCDRTGQRRIWILTCEPWGPFTSETGSPKFSLRSHLIFHRNSDTNAIVPDIPQEMNCFPH